LDIVKKIVPLTESSSPLGVSSWLRACLYVLGPSVAVGPRNNLPAAPLSHRPAASNTNTELRVKPYRDTGQLCLFLKHPHTFAHICNVASHSSNKWTFIFNASTAASLSTQHYGQNQARN